MLGECVDIGVPRMFTTLAQLRIGLKFDKEAVVRLRRPEGKFVRSAVIQLAKSKVSFGPGASSMARRAAKVDKEPTLTNVSICTTFSFSKIAIDLELL